MYQSFEDLEVWKRACQLSVRIYELLRECREFGLRDQMQRAGVSIASNIAEGSERGGKDFVRFLNIARGSAAELRTQCYIACKIGVLTTEQMTPLVGELKEISKMLTGLAKSIKQKLKPTTEN
jgi:four helix bundle protein